MNQEILDKSPIALAELKEELKKIQKRDEELGFRSGKTQEYVNSFSTLKLADYTKLKEELTALNIPRLKDEHIVKIADLLPINIKDLDVLLQGYPITIVKDNQQKIVDVVSKYKK